MATQQCIGHWGETVAQQHLLQKGYAILDTNWRMGHLEADIIAYNDGEVIFVEVKTRSGNDYGDPEIFVDWKKQRAYRRLANAYMRLHQRDEHVRFDIIALTVEGNSYRLNHIEDAFSTSY